MHGAFPLQRVVFEAYVAMALSSQHTCQYYLLHIRPLAAVWGTICREAQLLPKCSSCNLQLPIPCFLQSSPFKVLSSLPSPHPAPTAPPLFPRSHQHQALTRPPPAPTAPQRWGPTPSAGALLTGTLRTLPGPATAAQHLLHASVGPAAGGSADPQPLGAACFSDCRRQQPPSQPNPTL